MEWGQDLECLTSSLLSDAAVAVLLTILVLSELLPNKPNGERASGISAQPRLRTLVHLHTALMLIRSVFLQK